MTDRERLRLIKAAKDRLHEARAGNEKGLLIVHTGMGKGKTSAALNLVYRHLAHGLRAAVVQFVKSRDAYPSGDARMLATLRDAGHPVSIDVMGDGFTWETQDPEADRRAAERAWERSLALLRDPEVRLVVLDELHIALKHGQLALAPVLAGLAARAPLTHVVTTGRSAPPELIDAADLVTEMAKVKHPIAQGIPAQAGIEF